ncbi:MAG: hypothetical protein Q7J37_02660, partial [Candidatus Omnitrophota bacterium]|nr:hypothetical protein [Candidatus Omnitrophota bacterium]
MKKIILVFVFTFYCYAHAATDAEMITTTPAASPPPQVTEITTSPGNVTLDFKEADINNVLKIISYKSGINIVTTPDVIGNVSVRLADVPWELALDVILKTYGFGSQKQGNVILVTKIENVAKIAAEEALRTDIIVLKFLDAQDAQKIIIPLLSPRGKISVLYSRGQKGWQFGTFKIGRDASSSAALEKVAAGEIKSETVSYEKNAAGETVMKKADFDPSIKSKMLVITDTASSLDIIRNVILPKIDIKPKQVLIETKIIEVNRNKLRDIGLDWGLGSINAATDSTIAKQTYGSIATGGRTGTSAATTNPLVPSLFNPATSTILGYQPYNAGGEFIFQKLTGTKFEAVIHALEDNADTNTLSAPSILTLDNQEASMLVGYHTPILESTVTAGTSGTNSTITQTLDYYQEIGIRLNVVPQISEDGYINMIIHPSITSSNSNVTATSTAGDPDNATTTNYPIIDVREVQTQVLLKDKETIVIGGLLKDVKGKENIGI